MRNFAHPWLAGPEPLATGLMAAGASGRTGTRYDVLPIWDHGPGSWSVLLLVVGAGAWSGTSIAGGLGLGRKLDTRRGIGSDSCSRFSMRWSMVCQRLISPPGL